MVAGGLAGMLLADFGADVVKVEQPGTGDPLRQWTAGGEVRMHDVVPRLSETPGAIRWAGGTLGRDNEALFGELGLTATDLARLRGEGVI